MKEKVNIMCLYWVGSFRGRDFSYEDISRLYQSVEKHIDRPFDFYVLTNDPVLLQKEGIRGFHPDQVSGKWKTIQLQYAWPGWWSKVELHRPDLPEGRTLYMDLDSHCIRNLQPILDYPGDLVMFDTRTPLRNQTWKKVAEGWVFRYQAATMLFDPYCHPMRYVWNTFLINPAHFMKTYRSEQDIMGDWIPNQPTFPATWMCKLDTLRKQYLDGPPEEVIIVTGQTRDGLFRNTDIIPWFEKMAR